MYSAYLCLWTYMCVCIKSNFVLYSKGLQLRAVFKSMIFCNLMIVITIGKGTDLFVRLQGRHIY